jgi:cell division inhibitor SepF
MSLWKRAMDYLGLGPDDAYDDYDLPPMEPERPARQQPRSGGYYEEPRPARQPRQGGHAHDDDPQVRPVPRSLPSRDLEPVPSRQRASVSDISEVVPRPSRQGSAVRAVPVTAEPSTVRPTRFDQAQEVADKFKEGMPVIMNLEAADREISRRLIDFASGLCYGLNGAMEKVATGVYLLKPNTRHNDYDD